MMTLKTRYRICVMIVALSAVYGVVVASCSPALASAIGIGYIAIILTAMTLINVWKKQ